MYRNRYARQGAEMTQAIVGVGPLDAWRGNQIADWALDAARSHAEANSLGSVTDNEADALRHFKWNARMTHEIGYDRARIIADNHEYITWEKMEVIGGTINKITLDSLMDLHNNKMGRAYATANRTGSYYDLFNLALKEGALITDLDQVPIKYGIERYQIYGAGRSRYVFMFVPQNDPDQRKFLTLSEVARKKAEAAAAKPKTPTFTPSNFGDRGR